MPAEVHHNLCYFASASAILRKKNMKNILNWRKISLFASNFIHFGKSVVTNGNPKSFSWNW